MNYQINDIPVAIEYRNVKNINLYIKPPDGRILVTAPRRVSKKRIMEFVDSKAGWIEQTRRRMLEARERQMADRLTRVTKGQLEAMRSNVEKYVDRWEPVMGVHASAWTLRDMKTRWGSCSVDSGRIRLNKRLALYPEDCLEYVIVHELCHLLEPSHNQRFKMLMGSFMPDWKERKKRLGTG